jgi:CRP-like cAMP-binding protein
MERIERKRQLSEFDARLRDLARLAPDPTTKSDLNRALHYYRQRYCVPFEQKKVEIKRQIADGAATHRDLQIETGYAKKSLNRILDELLADGEIRSAKLRRTSGAGRPQICYFIAEP